MKPGFAAISTVLTLMAVMMAAVVTVTYLSVGEAQVGLAHQKGEEAWDLVDGCTEDLLLKIRNNAGFAGTSLVTPEGTCTVTYVSGGPNWEVVIAGGNSLSARKIRVLFTRGNKVQVSRWTEE